MPRGLWRAMEGKVDAELSVKEWREVWLELGEAGAGGPGGGGLTLPTFANWTSHLHGLKSV